MIHTGDTVKYKVEMYDEIGMRYIVIEIDGKWVRIEAINNMTIQSQCTCDLDEIELIK